MIDVSSSTFAALHTVMNRHVNSNWRLMAEWNQKIVVHNQTMSVEEVREFASSNLKASAAKEILTDLEWIVTASHIDEKIEETLSKQGADTPDEVRAVWLEAQSIIANAEEA